MAAITADQVVVELQAKTDKYHANLIKADQEFRARTTSMQDQATKAGAAVEKGLGGVASSLDNIRKIAGGVLPALANGFMSIINPASLATVAVAALTSVVLNWLTKSEKDIPRLNEALKEHAEIIKSLGPAYEEAIKKATEYVNSNPAVGDALARVVKAGLEKGAQGAAAELQTTLKGAFAAYSFGSGPLTKFSGEQIKPLADAMKAFNQSVSDGKPNVQELVNTIAAIGQEEPALRSFTDTFLVGAQKALEFETAVAAIPSAVDEAAMKFDELGKAVENIKSDTLRKEIEELSKKMEDGKISSDEMIVALQNLQNTNLDMAGPIAALFAFVDAAGKAQAAAGAISKQVMNPEWASLGSISPVFSAGGKFTDEQDVMNRRAAATKSLTEVEAEKAEKAAKRASKVKKEQINDYEKFNQKLTDSIALAEQELSIQGQMNPLVNDYGFALESARLYQEGLNAAKRAGIELDAGQLASLREQANYLATVKAGTEQLRESQDKVRASVEEWNDVARDAVSGLIDDLLSGKDASEAFANALGKIADKLIEIGLNNIFDSAGGGASGILGGLFSSFLGGKRANGGPVRGNTPYLVGERGPEIFTPNQTGQITPRIPSMPSVGAGSSSGSGTNVTVGVTFDETDGFKAYVKKVAKVEASTQVQQSQAGEIARLPGNLKQANQRGMIR